MIVFHAAHVRVNALFSAYPLAMGSMSSTKNNASHAVHARMYVQLMLQSQEISF